MPEQKPPYSLKPLLITTSILVSAIIFTSYVLFGSSYDISDTTINSTASNSKATSTSVSGIKQQNTETASEFFSDVSKEQLLGLLPSVSPDDSIPVRDRQALSLWQQADQDNNVISPDQLRIERVIADPAVLNQLEVGRKINFFIPHTYETVSARITAQQPSNNGVKVYDITLNDNIPLTGAQIVRGKKSTEATVITEQGTYTVSIDNKTGEGSIIDDSDLNIYRTGNDSILVPTQAPIRPDLDSIL
jgi:hypothetical protein